MAIRVSDQWETPQWLFDELNQEFNFDIDLCATKENSKCELYCTNYLSTCLPNVTGEVSIDGIRRNIQCAFMNPPYSNPKTFIEKAWKDSKHCKIVILVPNTIKTCRYMDILDENKGQSTFRKWKEGLEIRDLTRRTEFNHPEKQSSSPSFGCMLLIMYRRNM